MALTPADRATRRLMMEEDREARFRWRKERLEADPFIDPRRREWYLNRSLVNGIQAAQVLRLKSPQRIYSSSSGRNTMDVKIPPHPGAYLEIDEFNSTGACVELGRVLEMAEKNRQYTLNLDDGTLTPGRIRHGRTRSDRTMKSKPQIPGTPRKVRQRRADPSQ